MNKTYKQRTLYTTSNYYFMYANVSHSPHKSNDVVMI